MAEIRHRGGIVGSTDEFLVHCSSRRTKLMMGPESAIACGRGQPSPDDGYIDFDE